MLDSLVRKPVASYPALHQSFHQKKTEPIRQVVEFCMKTVTMDDGKIQNN